MHAKSRKRVLLAVCLSVAGALLLFAAYYLIRQASIVLKEPVGYEVRLSEDQQPASAEEEARLWLEGYMAQFQQFFIHPRDRIASYEIKRAEALDSLTDGQEAICRVDLTFLVDPAVGRQLPFTPLAAIDQEDGILVQWVVWLCYDESARTITAANITTRGAYDLEVYHASGQAEKDAVYHQYQEEVPPSDQQYTYKIAGGQLSVTYDKGVSWLPVPLSIDQINYYADGGHLTTNRLQEGSYVITPEKTAFLYGGGSNPLRCVYSDDMGKTWQTSQVSDLFSNGYDAFVRVRYCSFPTVQDGFAVIGSDKTMSSEAQTVFYSSDGGVTWKKTGDGPRTTLICDAGFVTKEVGFITYHYVEGAESAVYRTEDGGRSWQAVRVELDKELIPYLTEFKSPRWENGALALYVDEGADSDYPSVNPVRGKFVSSDLGKTWQYQELLEIADSTPG